MRGGNLSEDQRCWDCDAADYWVPDYMSEDDIRYVEPTQSRGE